MKQKEPVLTAALRKQLKETMQKEMENLPELLAALPPIDRANIICKLMPYIFGKDANDTWLEGW